MCEIMLNYVEIMSFLWDFSVRVYSQLWTFPYFVWHYLKLQENSVKLQIFFSALNQTPLNPVSRVCEVHRYKGIIHINKHTVFSGLLPQ